MEKWEYKTINIEIKGLKEGIPDFNMVINQLGTVGWELVSCFPANQEQGCIREIIAVLKRRNTGSLTELAEQSFNPQGRAHGDPEKGPRTRGESPRTFRKGPGYGENRADHPGKSFKYSGKGHGYKGKSSDYEGKASGYKGKSSGNVGTDSGYPAKNSGFPEKGAGYKGKSSGKGSRYKGRGPGA